MATAQPTHNLGVLFTGGGSGGHIYPNIAIAEQLRALEPALQVEFLVSRRDIDAQILEAESLPFTPICAQPLSFRPRPLIRLARNWGRAVRQARSRIEHMRAQCEHVAVVATGGFVSAPVANAARADGVPFILVNLDAKPGKANRFAARSAAERFTAADGDAPADWTRIRPIVRSRAIARHDPAHHRAALGLDPDKPTLLVTGASQGARSINAFLTTFATNSPEALAGWQVLHQTGAGADDSIASTYKDAGIPARVVPFIDAIGDAWGAADLVVSRAGAGSVAEAWANRTPTLFLPYPYHRDQHQRLNAEPLVRSGAARLSTDHIDADANLADAGDSLAQLLKDASARDKMRLAFDALGPADGAAQVAEAIRGLCRT